MAERKPDIVCPHCNRINDGRDWPDRSAWEVNRHVGETLCKGGCGNWIILWGKGDGSYQAFRSWPECEAAYAKGPTHEA